MRSFEARKRRVTPKPQSKSHEHTDLKGSQAKKTPPFATGRVKLTKQRKQHSRLNQLLDGSIPKYLLFGLGAFWILLSVDTDMSLSVLPKFTKTSDSNVKTLFPPLERPNLGSLSQTERKRYEAVQGAIRHAWRGYADVCLHSTTIGRNPYKLLGSHIPCDDLSAVSGNGEDWLFHAATLFDSLDTLALAFGTESVEYQEALKAVLEQDLQATALRPTKTFEYSLRIVGGLLGAFSVTGDLRLLARAKDAVDALLESPFRTSPTVLPRMYDVLFPPHHGNILYKLYSYLYQWGRDAFTTEHHYNSLAGVGSFALEFYFLSQTLGDERYRETSDRIFSHVAKFSNDDGTIPASWNVMTGQPSSRRGGLGSGSDSFVEYLFKVPLFACGADLASPLSECRRDQPIVEDMLERYTTIMDGPLQTDFIIRNSAAPSIVYPVEKKRYKQLLCFVPGLLALEYFSGESEVHKHRLTLAEDLLRGCHDMYQATPTGLGPEEVPVDSSGAVQHMLAERSYLLRPEYIESLFVLYRVTKNEEYREKGWQVFESLERFCKTELGYAGLSSVYDPEASELVDDMPSYFLAETLKYLLLLLGPADFLPLDDFVFTTEAHPMRRPRMLEIETLAERGLLAEINPVRSPTPWQLLWLVYPTSIGISILLWRCYCKVHK